MLRLLELTYVPISTLVEDVRLAVPSATEVICLTAPDLTFKFVFKSAITVFLDARDRIRLGLRQDIVS